MLAAVVFVVLALAPALNAQTAARKLQIVQAVVSQSEDGPALENGLLFQPGDIAYFSFQAENYKVGPNGKVQLIGHIQAFDPAGKPIVPRDEQMIGTSLSEEDKHWKPKLRLQIPLPSIAPPGNYTVRYDISDQQSHQSTSGQVAMPVGGKGVAPAATLTIRNVGFYRTQDDPTPLRIVAYRAGDILWARFDITGYKYADQNAIDVTYDVAVLTADGRQLFSQENAAVEKSQAFYPQPWVPAAFNLSLQSNMQAGTYTLVLTAHDGVGNQTVVAKSDFRVE